MNSNYFKKGNNNFRNIIINKEQDETFCSNEIVTKRYTIFSFLPLFLKDQFSYYSTIFFAVITALQQMPSVSTLGRYTTAFPLGFILMVSAIKEIIEDLKRNQEDKLVNNQITKKWLNKDDDVIPIKWKDIHVGQIIRVSSNLHVPADLLVIKSSNDSGLSYIETSHLDGESDIKTRTVPTSLLKMNLSDITSGTIICDHPNEIIYSFHGLMILSDGSKIPINEKHLLLRDVTLKHVEWIYGIVIYTGFDTKIWRNLRTPRKIKHSSSEVEMNQHMVVLFSLFIFLILFNAFMYLVYTDLSAISAAEWYLPSERFAKDLNVFALSSFIVNYSIIIPISLKVYWEIASLIQANFINTDIKMYDENKKAYAKVITSKLNSDLGQVKFIFTDKTGTLTENEQKLKACYIKGFMYETQILNNTLIDLCKTDEFYHQFFIAVCLCPGIIPIHSNSNNKIKYYSSFNDQLILVSAAIDYGYKLVTRNNEIAEIMVGEKILRYRILNEFEFTSERKRTSVIVRSSENKIYLYVMGADDVIFGLLSISAKFRVETLRQIAFCASSGLRILCLAMSELTEDQYVEWNRSFSPAKNALRSTQYEKEELFTKIEKNLHLLGITACEDKLQDKVPETISAFLSAGIKIWMLTGDRRETALSTGYSTKLITFESTVIVFDSENENRLRRLCDIISRNLPNRAVLVVSGYSLIKVLNSSFVDEFAKMSMRCDSVICYRMVPKQKAEIINLIQRRTRYVTVAVGDGANDVAMIKVASIGIGIRGREGLCAAYAADYSLTTFKQLRHLLLVHGTLNYNRVNKLIFFSYYKNFHLGTTLLLMSSLSHWSGTSFFEDMAIICYNVIFTAGSTAVVAIFDKQYPEDLLFNEPFLYQFNNWCSHKTLFFCLFSAFLHSIIIYYFTFYSFEKNTTGKNSHTDGYLIQGSILYMYILIIVTLKCMLHVMNWTIMNFCLILFSSLMWFPMLASFNVLYKIIPVNRDLVGFSSILLTNPTVWLNAILIPITVFLIDITMITLYREYWLYFKMPKRLRSAC